MIVLLYILYEQDQKVSMLSGSLVGNILMTDDTLQKYKAHPFKFHDNILQRNIKASYISVIFVMQYFVLHINALICMFITNSLVINISEDAFHNECLSPDSTIRNSIGTLLKGNVQNQNSAFTGSNNLCNRATFAYVNIIIQCHTALT